MIVQNSILPLVYSRHSTQEALNKGCADPVKLGIRVEGGGHRLYSMHGYPKSDSPSERNPLMQIENVGIHEPNHRIDLVVGQRGKMETNEMNVRETGSEVPSLYKYRQYNSSTVHDLGKQKQCSTIFHVPCDMILQ